MAITVLKGRKLGDQVAGGSEVRGSITGPGSYVSGGFAADIVTDFGVSASDIDYVIVTPSDNYWAQWDSVNKKILVYVPAGTQVSASTDLSAVTFYLTVKVKNTTA